MDRKKLSLFIEENLFTILKKNAQQKDTSLEKYVEKILKEFLHAK